jgi:hypothetical protein
MARWLIGVGLAGCVDLDGGRCEVEEVVLERLSDEAWSCGVGYDVENYGPTCLFEAWSVGDDAYWLDQSLTEDRVQWVGNVASAGVLWVISQENVGGRVGPVEARECTRVLELDELLCEEVSTDVERWCEPR